MNNKQVAVDLVINYQQLFSNLSHTQIAERLLKLVIENASIARAAIVMERDTGVYLEAHAVRLSDGPLVVRFPERPVSDISNHQNLWIQRLIGKVSTIQGGISPATDQAPIAENHIFIPIVSRPGETSGYCIELSNIAYKGQSEIPKLDEILAFSAIILEQYRTVREFSEQLKQFDEAKKALDNNEFYLDAILSHSDVLIDIKDLMGNQILMSDFYKKLPETKSHSLRTGIYHSPQESTLRAIAHQEQELLAQGDCADIEVYLSGADGVARTYLMRRFLLKNTDGEPFAVCSVCSDIDERKKAENLLREQKARLNYLAYHDTLTGLPNRDLLYERLNHCLVRSKKRGRNVIVMLLDLDRFKFVNDSLGHDAGDQLLKTVADRLKKCTRDNDIVARLGGDEFIVVLESTFCASDSEAVADKLLEVIAEPIKIGVHEVTTTASLGISCFPAHAETVDGLLKNADMAMYHAKSQGKNTREYYKEELSVQSEDSLALENDLRVALDSEQLELHFQPIYDTQTREIKGMEALTRWRHPQRGFISPEYFIELAEETGLIHKLGDWVMLEACRQRKRWLGMGLNDFRISVNLSPLQFRHHRFKEHVQGILDESGLSADYLEFEITESSAMEYARETIKMLEELNQMGISLAIDDFGTGYSSLAYLKRFPIQKLKIDRSFVDDIGIDQHDSVVTQAIISLGRSMDLKIVAEGVETEEQLNWLKERGCDLLQGYYLSRPMAAAALEVAMGWSQDCEDDEQAVSEVF